MPATLKRAKQETWGARLRRNVGYRDTSPTVDAIHALLGSSIGHETTFARLYSLDETPAHATQRFRAWLLLATQGYRPEDFDLSDADVPPVYDANDLRERLQNLLSERIYWSSKLDALAA